VSTPTQDLGHYHKKMIDYRYQSLVAGWKEEQRVGSDAYWSRGRHVVDKPKTKLGAPVQR
jgi:hypothetical protein